MLRSWLARQVRAPSEHKYAVIDVTELKAPDDATLDHLARELLLAYQNPVMTSSELEILLEDAQELQLDVIRDYIENEILPAPGRGTCRSIIVGNFGEVLAAGILIQFEGFTLPIFKLRLREKRDWAARLTDLCLIKEDGLPRPLVCFGEAKTKSTGKNLQLAIEGHASFARDDALANPEILRFIALWLHEADQGDRAESISRMRLGKTDYDKRHDLFLVHNEDSWNEEVLDRLDDHGLDDRLVDFSVKVILIAGLAGVIDEAYARMPLAAAELLDE
ncbi:MAG: hypothetical protein E3J64_07565 [Anaerolineales bacterium]|nr:MAG: hypothetical protein E3J64_07565 [Anaerolineales bacterium]